MPEEIKEAQKEQSVKEMFRVGAHFGYARASRHSSAKPFIFGFKNQTAIIDLEKTFELLEAAKAFVKQLGQDKKAIIFVGTKSEAQEPIKQVAETLNQPYVTERWIGGTLTNFKEIRKRIERMQELRSQSDKGELVKYTKKERGVIAKELADLERYFKSIASLVKLPGAIFLVDAKKETIAADEANKLHIPIVSLCSSDCDLRNLDYPIVANDSQMGSIAFFLKQIAGAYQQGLLEAEKVSEKKEG